jgi:hypothetical protein
MAEVLTTWIIPAESKEFIGPITVTADGTPVTTFEVAFTQTGPQFRPTTWTAADTVDGEKGILVGPGTTRTLSVGIKYTIWVRFTDNPEIPVLRVGYVKVT